MITMNAGVRNALMLGASTTALAGGVFLTARASTGEKPIVERALLGGIGLSSGAVGAHLLHQTAGKIVTSNARLGPALIAAGVVAGAAGIMAHYALS